MNDKIARLESLDNEKLIDVVKNYKQYGYDDELRSATIEILKERGIGKEQLEMSGNLENRTYNSAEESFVSFNRNSIIAFIFYILIFITSIFLPVLTLDSKPSTLMIISLICILVYFVFFIKSFINQINFFEIIGKHPGSGGAFMYFLVGVPLFVFLYLYYRNRMNEELKLIK